MIGRTLSHFKITAKLGVGGMGEVYRATDTDLGREVAVKILPEEVAEDNERLARFEREAKTLAALNHPNVVTIHSVEEDAGQRFLAMELVTGNELSELIPKGGMRLARIFELAIPLAEALAAAHDRGIVHRDLKPGNVMVTDEGRVKVLDFGLAKPVPEAARSGLSQVATEPLTGEGRILGTVPYMSPEQLEGREPDPRSDIFSLGVILFEMATSERPFSGDTPLSLMSSIVKDSPRAIDVLRPELPRHLARVIRRCLEKNPEHRYQSAKDVRNELTGLKTETESGAVAASEPAVSSPTEKRVWSRLVYGVGGLLLLAAVAYGVWRVLPPSSDPETAVAVERPSTGQKLIAVLPLRNLGPVDDEYFAAGITDEIVSRLATVRGLGIISGSSTAPYKDSDAGPKEIGEELGVDFVLSGFIRWDRKGDDISRVRISPKLIQVEDNIHVWAQVYDRDMVDIFGIQSEIALSVARELGSALLEPERRALEARPTTNQDAYHAYLRGRFVADSVWCDDIRRRIRYLRQAVELDPTFVQAWATLSQGYSSAFSHCPEHVERDRIEGRRALSSAERLSPDSWEVLLAKAQHLTQVEGDYELALEPLERAAELVNTSEVHFARGRIYRRLGRWEEAMASFRRAKELGSIDGVRARVAATAMWMRDYEEAIREYDRVIEFAPEVNMLYVRKAWIYWLWRGETDEARAVLETLPASEPSTVIQWAWFWQRIYEKRYQEAIDGLDVVPDDPMMQIDLFASPKPLLRAYAFELMGKPDLARSSFEEAREILEAEARSAPANSKVRQALAITYAGLGRRADALETASEVLALVPIDKEPYFGGPSLLEVALVHTMVGELALALDELDTLLSIPTVVTIPWLRLDPRWEPLWELPRFRELAEKYE